MWATTYSILASCRDNVPVIFFFLPLLDDFKFSPIIVEELKKDKVTSLEYDNLRPLEAVLSFLWLKVWLITPRVP